MASRHLAPERYTEGLRFFYGDTGHVKSIMPTMQASFSEKYGEAWTEHQCRSMLVMPGSKLLIAEYDSGVCGFAISRIATDEEELLMIAVHPQYQNLSIGTQLVEQLFSTAKDEGCRTVFLEVRSGNSAMRLYKQLGFKEIGLRKSYYTGSDKENYDAITLRKFL